MNVYLPFLQQPKDICARAGFCPMKKSSVRMEKLMPAKSISAVKMFPATKIEMPVVSKPAKVPNIASALSKLKKTNSNICGDVSYLLMKMNWQYCVKLQDIFLMHIHLF